MKNKELVEVNHEIELINNRVENIEQIASTIEELAEKGFEAFNKHLEHKEEIKQKELINENLRHEREVELESKIHKRSIMILSFAVFCIVTLVFTALLLGEKEVVKIILTSSLAVGAGFGLKASLTRNIK